ncbi:MULTISPECIES: co-chaperone DjlA [Methylocaldum]|jgi:DnaJ like chaperone protein|uniref:co-chaperone DjlA n=1 Tax=Methylocaldum sp. GT1BB TaxID=3438963 RepID=UPI0012EC7399|nr:co-chaperone DjlA [Methylocaldum sp.]MVF21494.1 co-chaperone DjlA [Methylocaldum sp. BRCS4]
MTWLGKVVGGTFGLFMGGPLFAILGAALGHQFDRVMGNVGLLQTDFVPGTQSRVQMVFFTVTFSVVGHIAKADGRVSEAEIKSTRAIMDRMGLSEDMRKTAIRLFNEGKRADFPLDDTLDQFRSECRRRSSLLRLFIELQLEAAYADGVLHSAEEQLLLRICDRLQFSRFEFHAIKARMEAELRFARTGSQYSQWRRERAAGARRPSAADAYAVLGITPSASDQEIRRAYRRLMSQHHPDKLVANGLPEEMVKLATEKTQQIRSAYDVIAKARKF